MGLLSSLNPKRSSGSSDGWHSDAPPDYKEAVGSRDASGFTATRQLQVEAVGYDFNQALTGKTLENITAYRVESDQAEYVSVRLQRKSNSCALVRASDASQTALISTNYRFGPGRRPKMHILPKGSNISAEQAINDDKMPGEELEAKSRSFISRAQVLHTSLGQFEWRYGSRDEKAACGADSLLIMERTDRGRLPDGSESKKGARVAQLIRNDELRTPGSGRNSGGNGGRLMMDLRMWEGEKSSGVDVMEAFAVASCILMLKREADRFIDNSIATVA